MAFRIYPPIGIARVGNSPTEFYIGPEIPGHLGVELSAAGETAVTRYKADEDEVKRQAARFRLFEVPDGGGVPRPAQLPTGATVEWTVRLVNKKAAVQRGGTPPVQPTRPVPIANPAGRVIDPGLKLVAGANAPGVAFGDGEFLGRRVPLGEIRTDKDQHLLVLGGYGFSSSPTNAPLPSFYTNPGWHDDTSDGPVTARVRLAGDNTVDAAPAWVIVATPDYAPGIQGVVTLYDTLFQVGIDRFGVQPPVQVSFTQHVFPLLQRARRLRWVHADPNWLDVSDDWPRLADASAAQAGFRGNNAELVRSIRDILSRYDLTRQQKSVLDKWEAGTFASDWVGLPQPGGVTADGLTRAALDSTVGQGFFPGIEAGILLTDHSLYRSPFDFRIDHRQAAGGDLTAQMAVPWQADFFDCARSWWPSQRPDDVRVQAAGPAVDRWERGVNSHLGMVNNFAKLGFVTAQKDAQGNIVFAEDQRALADRFV